MTTNTATLETVRSERRSAGSPRARRTWHVITSEYPPDPGGVSDHTRGLVRGLAAVGDVAHVWCPVGPPEVDGEDDGVHVHRCLKGFGRAELDKLGAALDRLRSPRTLLVQWVPQGFGHRGANLGFARWLRRRRRGGDVVEPIVHEPYLPWGGGPLRRGLAGVQRWMLRTVLDGATRVWASTTSWEPYCRAWSSSRCDVRWLPIASSVPRSSDAGATRDLRDEFRGRFVVGHFGTFGPAIVPRLDESLPRLLDARPDVAIALVGRGAMAYRERMLAAGGNGDRIEALDGGPLDEVATWIAACDVMWQPFSEGVTTRRTTVMAGLRNGRPIVTTCGRLTESPWMLEDAVRLVGEGESAVGAIVSLLDDAGERDRLGRAAARLYERRFAVENAVRLLREDRP